MGERQAAQGRRHDEESRRQMHLVITRGVISDLDQLRGCVTRRYVFEALFVTILFGLFRFGAVRQRSVGVRAGVCMFRSGDPALND